MSSHLIMRGILPAISPFFSENNNLIIGTPLVTPNIFIGKKSSESELLARTGQNLWVPGPGPSTGGEDFFFRNK